MKSKFRLAFFVKYFICLLNMKKNNVKIKVYNMEEY